MENRKAATMCKIHLLHLVRSSLGKKEEQNLYAIAGRFFALIPLPQLWRVKNDGLEVFNETLWGMCLRCCLPCWIFRWTDMVRPAPAGRWKFVLGFSRFFCYSCSYNWGNLSFEVLSTFEEFFCVIFDKILPGNVSILSRLLFGSWYTRPLRSCRSFEFSFVSSSLFFSPNDRNTFWEIWWDLFEFFSEFLFENFLSSNKSAIFVHVRYDPAVHDQIYTQFISFFGLKTCFSNKNKSQTNLEGVSWDYFPKFVCFSRCKLRLTRRVVHRLASGFTLRFSGASTNDTGCPFLLEKRLTWISSVDNTAYVRSELRPIARALPTCLSKYVRY